MTPELTYIHAVDLDHAMGPGDRFGITRGEFLRCVEMSDWDNSRDAEEELRRHEAGCKSTLLGRPIVLIPDDWHVL